MVTRRQMLAGGVGTACVLVSGCSTQTDDTESSRDDDGISGPDRTDDDKLDDEKDELEPSATLEYDIDTDRSDWPRITETAVVELTVSNESERTSSYEYRLWLEHDGDEIGSESISGELAGSKQRTHEFEFSLRRTGAVTMLVDKDAVDEFRVRSRQRPSNGDDAWVSSGGSGELSGTEESGEDYKERN